MSVNFEYYHIFYHVALSKSITAASKLLYTSQPTVSRAMKALERDLGCPLVVRSRQGVELTQQGQYLFAHIKKAYSIMSFAERQIADASVLDDAVLRVGVSEYTLRYFLADHLARISKEKPGLRVELDFVFEKRAVELLSRGDLDIALLVSPFKYDDPDIALDELRPYEMKLVAGNGLTALMGRSVKLAELSEYPFIRMTKDSSGYLYEQGVFESAGVFLAPRYSVSSAHALVSLAQKDLGVGFVPEQIAFEASKNHSMFCVDLAESLPVRHICALTSRSFSEHAARDLFLSLLQAG